MKVAAFSIPLVPAVSAAVLLLFGKRLGERVCGVLGTLSVTASFAGAAYLFWNLLSLEAHRRLFIFELASWIASGSLKAPFELLVDPLSITMVLVITGVGALIHLYSIGYMKGDARFGRFFAYMNLFVASMAVLVLANNLVLMFLGWEGVGLCSYLLISFWFERPKAAAAGKKAFVTNRVGDLGFILGALLLFRHTGTVRIASEAGSGLIAKAPVVLSGSTATVACLLLFAGATGKSAQFPLLVWLPDAMEGPTPVSALIHAATMVTAGVFLVARLGPVFAISPTASWTVAGIGTLTAFVAATAALAQTDLKKILAYSTVSQLGLMFAAVGVGALAAGIFHLVTHAFFKALLFLGAGSVMHATNGETDIRRFGGLRRHMPITSATFLVGFLAISGIPPLAGFFSKDAILTAVFGSGTKGQALWVVLSASSFLTALYMSRAFMRTFYGSPGYSEAEIHPHESPPVMTVPLVVLASGSAIAGVLGIPRIAPLLSHFLEPSVGIHPEAFGARELAVGFAALVLAVSAIWAGGRLWLSRTAEERGELLASLPFGNAAYRFFASGWMLDRLYEAIFVTFGSKAASFLATTVDRNLIDGIVDGVGALFTGAGRALKKVQTGYARRYALAIAAGVLLLLTGAAVARIVAMGS
ncbi:MAG: NADH-quinone oxidoreductase subunit L [Acidimicrobiia bacterium]